MVRRRTRNLWIASLILQRKMNVWKSFDKQMRELPQHAIQDFVIQKVVTFACSITMTCLNRPTLKNVYGFSTSHSEFAFCNSYNVVFGEEEFFTLLDMKEVKSFSEPIAHHLFQWFGTRPIQTAAVSTNPFGFSMNIGIFGWPMAKVGHWGHTIPEFLQWYRKLSSGRYEEILKSGYRVNNFAKAMRREISGICTSTFRILPVGTHSLTKP